MANVCLIVIDGWGVAEHVKGNAILNAATPVMDELAQKKDQYVTLDASGLAVGLPAGLMGNSEVGHFTIGTGRVTYQDIVAINKSIEEKTFHNEPNLVKMFSRAKSGNGRVHFLGLVSDGGVHSHIDHLFALLEAAKQHAVPNCFVHFFADGRDTSPTSGVTYVKQLQEYMSSLNYGSLSTLTGRYYAMDRDKRYERIKLAYDGMVNGTGEVVSPDRVIDVMTQRYNGVGDQKMTDEFMKPIIIDQNGLVQDGDTLLFIDFRADRMRQIVEAFGIKPQFDVATTLKDLEVVTMTEYKKEFPFNNLFPPEVPINTLAEWLSKKGIPQFHCAETEKYAHVTFFFNGGVEKPFDKEDRLMVPSPKVATYDLQPEMSVAGVGQAVSEAVASGKYPFVMCNFAPPDMVGHTGVYEAAVKACEVTDEAIGVILKACVANGYNLLITADHGNAETMIDDNDNPVTKHTTNRVPFSLTGKAQFKVAAGHNACLSDVAPTILHLMGIDMPPEMSGTSLVA
ncbi:2,3-bisphosphoglycerate-independent phosphoglycerate mutase-like [Dysidea avara]|uniref:2,3-bisphosphoglycerate-independent phosphoglycerate mutase-like n=1 Tax=Dysidea avara TaxID=196820 RepID=UPI00331B6F06